MGSEHDILGIVRRTASVLIEIGSIDQCVSGSAILLKVLRENGFPAAYPLTVGVKIVNSAQPETGIWLGKGTDAVPGKWPGHLVVIVPNYDGDDHLMMDLTLVQVNGLVDAIALDPFLGMVDEQFINGGQPAGFSANDCELTYEAFPTDDSYVRETNWSNIPGLDGIVKRIAERTA